MSNYKAKITLEAEDRASKGIKDVDDAFDELVSSTDKGSKKITSNSKAVETAMSAIASAAKIAMAATATALGVGIYRAIEFNTTMENSKIALAGMFQSFTNVGGSVITFNRAMIEAEVVQTKLKVAAMSTAASYVELSGMFQTIMPQALQAGFNTDQIVKFSQTLSAFAVANKQSTEEISQQFAMILGGRLESDSKLGVMLKGMGVTQEQLASWKAAGTMYEEMNKRLVGFVGMGTEIDKTWSAVFSNLQDGIDQLLGTSFKPFTDQLKETVLGISSSSLSGENAIVLGDIGKEATEILKGLAPVFEQLITFGLKFSKELLEGFNSLIPAIKVLAGTLSSITNFFLDMPKPIKVFIGLLVGIPALLYAIGKATIAVGAISTKTFTSISASLALLGASKTFETIKLGAMMLGAGFQIVTGQIALAEASLGMMVSSLMVAAAAATAFAAAFWGIGKLVIKFTYDADAKAAEDKAYDTLVSSLQRVAKRLEKENRVDLAGVVWNKINTTDNGDVAELEAFYKKYADAIKDGNLALLEVNKDSFGDASILGKISDEIQKLKGLMDGVGFTGFTSQIKKAAKDLADAKRELDNQRSDPANAAPGIQLLLNVKSNVLDSNYAKTLSSISHMELDAHRKRLDENKRFAAEMEASWVEGTVGEIAAIKLKTEKESDALDFAYEELKKHDPLNKYAQQDNREAKDRLVQSSDNAIALVKRASVARMASLSLDMTKTILDADGTAVARFKSKVLALESEFNARKEAIEASALDTGAMDELLAENEAAFDAGMSAINRDQELQLAASNNNYREWADKNIAEAVRMGKSIIEATTEWNQAVADKMYVNADTPLKGLEAAIEIVIAGTKLVGQTFADIVLSFKDGLVDIFSGGDVKAAFQGFISTISASIADSFVSTTVKLLSSRGGFNEPETLPDGSPNPKYVDKSAYATNAAISGINIVAGLTAGGGASDHWQGLASGASMGAMIGSIIPGLGNAIGALIGGVIGLVAGLLKKSQGESKLQITDATRRVSGTFNQVMADAYGKIEKSINGTLGTLTDIFTIADPATSGAFSKALRDSWQSFLKGMRITIHAGSESDFLKDIDAATGELLKKNLIKIGMGFGKLLTAPAIPGIDNYDQYIADPTGTGPIKTMLTDLGFTVDAINEIGRQIDLRTTDEWLTWVKGLVEVVVGFNEASRLLKMNREELYAYLDGQNVSAPEQFKASADAILDLVENLSLYSGDEQIAKGKEILELTQQRWEAELKFIASVRDLINNIDTTIKTAITKMGDAFKDENWLNSDRRNNLYNGTWREKIAAESDPNKISKIVGETIQLVEDLFNSLLSQFNSLKAVKATLDGLAKAFKNFGAAVKQADTGSVFEDFINGTNDFQTMVTETALLSGTDRVKAEQNVAAEATRRYNQEIQLIQQINGLIESIHNSIEAQKFDIKFGMIDSADTDGQANYILDEIERQKILLSQATNPEAVAAATARIQQLVTQYLGLFPEGDVNRGKAEQWAIDMLDWVDTVSGDLLEEMGSVLQDAADLYGQIIEDAAIETGVALDALKVELDGLTVILTELNALASTELNDIVDQVIASGAALAVELEKAKANFQTLNLSLQNPETGGGSFDKAGKAAAAMADAFDRATNRLLLFANGGSAVNGTSNGTTVNLTVQVNDSEEIASYAADQVYYALKNNPNLLNSRTGV